MSEPEHIVSERIIECNWGIEGGIVEYDISYLHEEWDILSQSYRIESVTLEGYLVYTSEFLLFKKGEIVPSDFSSYSKKLKKKLWQLIFAVKRKFFDEVRPDVVEHFIKQPYSVEQRYKLYKKWLDPPGYDVEKTKHTIIYIKRTSPNDGGGSSFIGQIEQIHSVLA